MTQSPNDKQKNDAFAKALEGLYKQYPLAESQYRKVNWRRESDRRTAIRNAQSGSPLFMIELFAVQVPRDEIRTIHALIYG